MSLKLILLCKEGEAREAYLREAKKISIDVDVVATYGELFQTMISNPYQGVMIDLVTSMKAAKDEKGIAQEILEVFPIVQVRWDSAINSVRVMSLGKSVGCDTLAEFAESECRHFASRAIRLDIRKSINFNATVITEEALNGKSAERTVTINFSKGGCFLFSTQDWTNIKTVSFIINELQDKTPLKGEIKWSVNWGKAMVIPGFGLRFTDIKDNQLEELKNKYQI